MTNITFDQWRGEGYCICCNTELHEIDPDIICMDCVDIECNVKDER